MAILEDMLTRMKLYSNETDFAALSDTELASMIRDGYREFRQYMSVRSPSLFETSESYTLSNVRELDLSTTAPIIMGAGVLATSSRVVTINTIAVMNGTNILYVMDGAGSLKELENSGISYYPQYLLAGNTLRFDRDMTGTISINYLGEDATDYTKFNSGDNEYVECKGFDDVPVLMAYSQYAIFDTAENSPLLRQLENRKADIRRWVEMLDGNRYIVETLRDWV